MQEVALTIRSREEYEPLNEVHLRGFLTEPARVFASRSGQPRLCFRLEVWIDDKRLPPKKPARVDYFSVVAFGHDFLPLAPQLVEDREVLLTGRLRSRDIDTDARHVVTEIVARKIVPLQTRADAVRGKKLLHATIQ
jgi:single-stranded DNA-binding protein